MIEDQQVGLDILATVYRCLVAEKLARNCVYDTDEDAEARAKEELINVLVTLARLQAEHDDLLLPLRALTRAHEHLTQKQTAYYERAEDAAVDLQNGLIRAGTRV